MANQLKLQLMVVLLFATISCTSATVAEPDITGVYHTSSGGDPQGGGALYILPNHKFVVVSFGAAAMGTWEIIRNDVLFKPQFQAAGFKIYGRHNNKLGDSIRVFFGGFERSGGAAVGFNQPPKPLLTKVFNDAPNCIDYPSVAKFYSIPKTITFAAQLVDEMGSVKASDAWRIYTYHNEAKYNDFIANYNPESNNGRPQDFKGEIKDGKLYFDQKLAEKKPLLPESEDLKAVNQLLDTPLDPDQVFYNPYYNEVSADLEKDTLNYRFDAKKNAYISFRNYVEGEEDKSLKDGNYNSLNVIYQFKKLASVVSSGQIDVVAKPIFTAICKNQEQ